MGIKRMKESITIELELEDSLAEPGLSVSMRAEKEKIADETSKRGHLPAYSGILDLFGKWQENFEKQVVFPRRKGDKTETFSYTNLTRESAEALKANFNNWWHEGNDKEWKKIRQKILTWARRTNDANEVTPIIVRADNSKLWQLPWSALKLSEDEKEDVKVEFVFSLLAHESRSRQPKSTKVRILAVLGEKDNSETPGWFRKLWQNLRGFLNLRGLGNLIPPLVDSNHQKKDNSGKIDVQFDRAVLKKFTPGAAITFLEGPSKEELLDHLRNDKWHIFFFAGHSSTDKEGHIGKFQIKDEELTIEELKNHFKMAIENGLQLAIFNSCDGVGLAKQLAELDLPCSIVMRLPVPDKVAQMFLQVFLERFAKEGKSLYAAVYETRGLLKDVFKQYPGVGWLPMICQNPGVGAGSWEEWTKIHPMVWFGVFLITSATVISLASWLYYPFLLDEQLTPIKVEISQKVCQDKNQQSKDFSEGLYSGDLCQIKIAITEQKGDVHVYAYYRFLDKGESLDLMKRHKLQYKVGKNIFPIPPDVIEIRGEPGKEQICVMAFSRANPYLEGLSIDDKQFIGRPKVFPNFQYVFWNVEKYLEKNCSKETSDTVTFENLGERKG
jgi:hypothetical protein